jgi:hypothetical protein
MSTLVQNGAAVNFGFISTAGDYGLTDSGGILKGYLLQNATHAIEGEREAVKALQGDDVSHSHTNIHRKGTLKFVISAAGRAASIASSVLAPWGPGSFVVVTACASQPDLVGTWECQSGAEIVGDITKSAEITIPIEKYVNITSASPA